MNVVVLAGGISTERDVSLNTGINVLKALQERGVNAKLLDLFLGYENDIKSFFNKDNYIDNEYVINDNSPILSDILSKRNNSNELFGPNVLNICKKADMVFIALHGKDGENGKVQATFDLLGIKYTGTGYLGSAIAMNKYVTKQLLVLNNIKTPNYKYYRKGDIIPKYKEPVVIKPTSGGSSVGVSICFNEEEYNKAIDLAFSFEDELLIEDYIKGREFSIGILGNMVLPPIEIIPKEGFYDYKNKYQKGLTDEICPANIDIKTTNNLKALAKKVFDILKLEVYGRIDVILKDNEFYVLEANSLPGLTSMSLLPQEANKAGINYFDLCMKIINLSNNKKMI